jgi:hypothetical protein
LLYDKRDLILIAKTGFEKIFIFQSLPLIQAGKLNYYALEPAARGAGRNNEDDRRCGPIVLNRLGNG